MGLARVPTVMKTAFRLTRALGHMSEGRTTVPLSRPLGRVGLDRLASALPGARTPLVGYALLVVIVELGVLQGARFLTGHGLSIVENPLWLLRQPTLIGAALATGHLHRRYDRAVAETNLLDRAENPAAFRRLVSPRLTGTVVVVGLAFTLANAVAVIGLSQLYGQGGLADVLQFLVVIPFGYVPVLAAFLATYASVEVALPRRILRSNVPLYYLDPENLGGMRPVGELLKLAYYYLLSGLVIYAVALYGPYILDGVLSFTAATPPGLVANAGFTAVWAASVGTMLYGIHTLHRFMRRQKREKLQRLDAQARECVEDPWDVERFEVPDEAAETYDDVRARMERVSATREYPATFTMWAQLAVGVMIPKAVQMLLAAI